MSSVHLSHLLQLFLWMHSWVQHLWSVAGGNWNCCGRRVPHFLGCSLLTLSSALCRYITWFPKHNLPVFHATRTFRSSPYSYFKMFKAFIWTHFFYSFPCKHFSSFKNNSFLFRSKQTFSTYQLIELDALTWEIVSTTQVHPR